MLPVDFPGVVCADSSQAVLDMFKASFGAQKYFVVIFSETLFVEISNEVVVLSQVYPLDYIVMYHG